jgi:hypothetical protein
MAIPSRTHVLRQLKTLEKKGCIRIGNTNRDGTLYEIILPQNIPSVIKRLASPRIEKIVDDDWFTNPERRRQLYERDDWVCQYCGEKVTEDNVTLDHFIPRWKDGPNQKENLRTACLICNSIKSGKPYEEVAVKLLESIKERQRRKKAN